MFSPSSYSRLVEAMQDMGTKTPSSDFTDSKIKYANDYVELCRSAFEKKEKELKIKEQALKETQKTNGQEEF